MKGFNNVNLRFFLSSPPHWRILGAQRNAYLSLLIASKVSWPCDSVLDKFKNVENI